MYRARGRQIERERETEGCFALVTLPCLSAFKLPLFADVLWSSSWKFHHSCPITSPWFQVETLLFSKIKFSTQMSQILVMQGSYRAATGDAGDAAGGHSYPLQQLRRSKGGIRWDAFKCCSYSLSFLACSCPFTVYVCVLTVLSCFFLNFQFCVSRIWAFLSHSLHQLCRSKANSWWIWPLRSSWRRPNRASSLC